MGFWNNLEKNGWIMNDNTDNNDEKFPTFWEWIKNIFVPQHNTKRQSNDDGEWMQKTINVWNRKIEELPIAIDIPRLAKFITLCDHRGSNENQLVGFRDDNNDTKIPSIGLMLIEFARVFEGEEKCIAMKKLIDESINEGQGLGNDKTVVMALFQKYGRDTKVVKILKAINQAMIAPAVIELRMKICPKIMFKDGTVSPWTISVDVHDNEVIVCHQRVQQSIGKAPGEGFEFIWHLNIVFDSDISKILSVNIVIPKLEFGKKIPKKLKDDVLKLFKDYMYM